MGRLISNINYAGFTIEGVTLGAPIEGFGLYAWDDPTLPDGIIEDDGTVSPFDEATPDAITAELDGWAGLDALSSPFPSVPAEVVDALVE